MRRRARRPMALPSTWTPRARGPSKRSSYLSPACIVVTGQAGDAARHGSDHDHDHDAGLRLREPENVGNATGTEGSTVAFHVVDALHVVEPRSHERRLHRGGRHGLPRTNHCRTDAIEKPRGINRKGAPLVTVQLEVQGALRCEQVDARRLAMTNVYHRALPLLLCQSCTW